MILPHESFDDPEWCGTLWDLPARISGCADLISNARWTK
jgi:hypothetical protein